MAGNRENRNMNSVYQRAQTVDADAHEGGVGREEVPEEHVTAADSSSLEDELVR
jgi:hypothetical protein